VVDELEFIVMVLVTPPAVGVRVCGAKVTDVPALGKPVSDSVTGEEKPPTDVSVTVYWTLPPVSVVADVGVAVIVKSGAWVTLS